MSRYNFAVSDLSKTIFARGASVEREMDLETYGALAGCDDIFRTSGLAVYFFDEPKISTCVFIYSPFSVVSCYAQDDEIASRMLLEFIELTGTREIHAPEPISNLHRTDERAALVRIIGLKVA